MKNFIEVTKSDATKSIISVEHIIQVSPSSSIKNTKTKISLTNGDLHVAESYGEIMEKLKNLLL